jgi:hypothetical protein
MPLTAIRTLRLDRPAINFLSWKKKKTSTKLLELVFIPEFLQIQAPLGFQEPGNTHRIVSELIDGVENTKIPSLLFENSSYSRLQLLGRAKISRFCLIINFIHYTDSR